MIRLEKIQDGQIKNNTYLLEEDGEAVIIDAAASAMAISEKLNGATVKGVILTHAHYDHFTYLKEILQQFKTKCYLTEKAFKKLTDPYLNLSERFNKNIVCNLNKNQYKFIDNGEVLPLLKNKQIFVLSTPGHSDCGISIKVDNLLFTGDTLFKQTVGRSDLPTSDGAALRESLRKLFKIKENCVVCPGHYEDTTLNEERPRIV